MGITYSEFSVAGDNAANIIFATAAANPSDEFAYAYGFGGDDAIVRDRTGGYDPGALYGPDFFISGGSGFDVVSYVGAPKALTASLTGGYASLNNSGGSAYFDDTLLQVEGLVGTTFGDLLVGDALANKLWGHDGNDTIWGLDGNDTLWGGQGNDGVYGGSGNDKLYGENGHDIVYGHGGSDLAYGGDGNDQIRGGDEMDVLHGDGGNDSIRGDAGNDHLHGGEGDDLLEGGSGQDTIHVGPGDDTVLGGSDSDAIHVSGAGDNEIDGGGGFDRVVYGGNAAVTVNLWNGTANRADGSDSFVSIERVETGGGNDVIFGTAGLNVLRSGGGHDTVYTMGGNDEVRAGSGNDTVVGYSGGEDLLGESGADMLSGGNGEDTIWGGSGNDLIDGGDGADTLYGGADADVFLFEAGDLGRDLVEDFNPNQDRIAFSDGYFVGQHLPGFDVTEVLFAYSVDGRTMLAGNRAGLGVREIAEFEGVSEAVLDQRIANGTIFDVEVGAPLGGGGGLAGSEPGGALWNTAAGWDVLA